MVIREIKERADAFVQASLWATSADFGREVRLFTKDLQEDYKNQIEATILATIR
jgi:hypothetical protein